MDIIEELREQIKLLKEKDPINKIITIESLERCLDSFEKIEKNDNAAFEIKKYELEYQKYIIDSEATNQWNRQSASELFKATLDSAFSAIKAPFLLNGAASLSMLTFIGKVSTDQNSSIIVSDLSCSLFIFCIGVLFSSVASAAMYFAQAKFQNSYEYMIKNENNDQKEENEHGKRGEWWKSFSIAFVVCSYVLFIYGIYTAHITFGNLH